MVTAQDTAHETDQLPSAPVTGQARGTPQGAAKHRFRIAFDVVAAATADLDDKDREALRWVAQYGRAKNISHEEIAAKLKKPDGAAYSGDSLYQALTGRREPEQLKNLIAAIIKFRDIEEERAGQAETGFIATAISRRVFSACRRAFLRRKIVFIWGESQIGKTTALREYARLHNHGETVYVRMPTGGSLDSFMRELASVLGIPTGNRAEDLRRRINECFDDRMLLIVDEAHECLSEHYSQKRGIRTLNYLREIFDRRGCGVVLSATNVFRDALLRGPHARNLRQLWLRGMAPLQLPDRPGQPDLAAFAAAYGLGPAPDELVAVRVSSLGNDGREQRETLERSPLALQNKVIAEYGLGRWNMVLQEASDMARERRKTITWSAVVSAHHQFELMQPVGEEAAR